MILRRHWRLGIGQSCALLESLLPSIVGLPLARGDSGDSQAKMKMFLAKYLKATAANALPNHQGQVGPGALQSGKPAPLVLVQQPAAVLIVRIQCGAPQKACNMSW